MKKIMFLVCSDSVFTRIYIKELLKVEKVQITVIGFQKTKHLEFYKKHNIEYLYMPRKLEMDNGLQWFKTLLFMYANRGRYDYIHVHSIIEVALKCAKLLAGKKGKIVLTYWGGDTYTKSHETFLAEKPYVDAAYKMNVMTDDMKDIINQEYDFAFDSKCRVINFGNSTFRYMDQYVTQYGKERLTRVARRYFGLSMNKIVIAVGHNGRSQQQHLRVIQQIKNYPEEIKQKIFLYCHMGYDDGNEYYARRVKDALRRCGCEYKINDKFLTASYIAVMRMGVDIFVHAGKYDAISDSMLEYLYAGKKVLNPGWIEYRIFEEKGVRDIKYKDFDELGKKLLEAIEQPYWSLEVQKNNHDKVAEISSWDILLPQWLELYE